MSKHVKKIPWEPKWFLAKEKKPEDGSLVIVSLQNGLPIHKDKLEILNDFKEDSWSIITEEMDSNSELIQWRVFTQDDLSIKIKEMEGFILQEYISGNLEKIDIEKMYGIKRKTE